MGETEERKFAMSHDEMQDFWQILCSFSGKDIPNARTYDIDISDTPISRTMDKILPTVTEWQAWTFEEVCAVVFMDAIHYHVRRSAPLLCVNGIIKIPTFGGENSPLCYARFKPFIILKA